MTDEPLLKVQFVGPLLAVKGIAIYDLGQTLVAIQRAIHKAYSAQRGTLEKETAPIRGVRKLLALQIEDRARGSDIYSLAPLITDPVAMTAVKEAVKFFLEGIVAYTKGTVQAVLRQSDSKSPSGQSSSENQRIYVGDIYAQVVNIVNRVDNTGECKSITLDSPALPSVEAVTFTKDTKEYVHSLKDQYFLGAQQELEGNVVKLYPNQNIVEIKRPGGKKCRIHLQPTDFEVVRYKLRRSSIIRVAGRPRYPLGFTGRSFDEFEATSVTLAEE